MVCLLATTWTVSLRGTADGKPGTHDGASGTTRHSKPSTRDGKPGTRDGASGITSYGKPGTGDGEPEAWHLRSGCAWTAGPCMVSSENGDPQLWGPWVPIFT